MAPGTCQRRTVRNTVRSVLSLWRFFFERFWLIGNVVGPHYSCARGLCNFSHAQQWQLLPKSDEETLGIAGASMSVGRMVDPIDVQK